MLSIDEIQRRRALIAIVMKQPKNVISVEVFVVFVHLVNQLMNNISILRRPWPCSEAYLINCQCNKIAPVTSALNDCKGSWLETATTLASSMVYQRSPRHDALVHHNFMSHPCKFHPDEALVIEGDLAIALQGWLRIGILPFEQTKRTLKKTLDKGSPIAIAAATSPTASAPPSVEDIKKPAMTKSFTDYASADQYQELFFDVFF
jgi:hypothetical protein